MLTGFVGYRSEENGKEDRQENEVSRRKKNFHPEGVEEDAPEENGISKTAPGAGALPVRFKFLVRIRVENRGAGIAGRVVAQMCIEMSQRRIDRSDELRSSGVVKNRTTQRFVNG
jgi:hypothetical protein